MEKTDFGMTNATTFDHHGSKIAVFFIQASIYTLSKIFVVDLRLPPLRTAYRQHRFF